MMSTAVSRDLVLTMDVHWRPPSLLDLPEVERAGRASHRMKTLCIDLADAFAGVDVTPGDLQGVLSIWRRRAAQDPDPMAQQRRPTAYDLRALYDQAHPQGYTTGTCEACQGLGRRHVTVAIWKDDAVAAHGLVVRCECPAGGRAIHPADNAPLLNLLGEWQRAADRGTAKCGAYNVVAVLDVSPVYSDVVAWALRNMWAGVVPEESDILEVLRAVEAAKEAA